MTLDYLIRKGLPLLSGLLFSEPRPGRARYHPPHFTEGYSLNSRRLGAGKSKRVIKLRVSNSESCPFCWARWLLKMAMTHHRNAPSPRGHDEPQSQRSESVPRLGSGQTATLDTHCESNALKANPPLKVSFHFQTPADLPSTGSNAGSALNTSCAGKSKTSCLNWTWQLMRDSGCRVLITSIWAREHSPRDGERLTWVWARPVDHHAKTWQVLYTCLKSPKTKEQGQATWRLAGPQNGTCTPSSFHVEPPGLPKRFMMVP